MVAFFASLQTEGFAHRRNLYNQDFTATEQGSSLPCFLPGIYRTHKTIFHTLTAGYDPQTNGAAERSVDLKSLGARALASANLDQMDWSYAVRHAAQSLLYHALQKNQRSLPFGTTVVTQVLGHREVKFPTPRSMTGCLLFWDHLGDQISYPLPIRRRL